jgi:hypothetical protein
MVWAIAAIDQPTLLGLAALVTATGGIASTIMALRRSRSEDHEACLEHLREARAEAEEYSAELHKVKMELNDLKLDLGIDVEPPDES